MTIIDARALREPFPTGVTEVAGQFIKNLDQIIPDAVKFTGEKNFSNSLTNFSLMCGLTTLEQQSGVHTKGKNMKIGILTGGGDCPGLNAVVRGVTKAALRRGWDQSWTASPTVRACSSSI